MKTMSLFTFITAGPYHEFIEAVEASAIEFQTSTPSTRRTHLLCAHRRMDQSRAGEGFRIIASKRSSKDDIYRAMFLEDDD